MITFQYQILRYRPDQVSGEFSNVGIVMYSQEHKFLKCKVIQHIGRVHHLFPGVHSRLFISSLKGISELINAIGLQKLNELDTYHNHSLEQITTSVLPLDNSSLYFDIVNSGIDLSLDVAFDDLFSRIVNPEITKEEEVHSDAEVWQKIYKPYFEKLNITHRFGKKIIKTQHTELELEHAVQNGKLHVLEPAAFNLSNESRIKDKVLKYSGLLHEVGTQSEETQFHLLAKMPDSPELTKFILAVLNNSSGTSTMNIVTENDFEDFASQLMEDLQEHK